MPAWTKSAPRPIVRLETRLTFCVERRHKSALELKVNITLKEIPGIQLSISAPYQMADTPTAQLPIDPREQPVLDQLLAIRTSLTLLKQDRSTYVKSSDVIPLYDQVIAQVKILNDLRSDHPREENRGEFILRL